MIGWTYLIVGLLLGAFGGVLTLVMDNPDDVDTMVIAVLIAAGGVASLIGCVAVGVAAGNRDSR